MIVLTVEPVFGLGSFAEGVINLSIFLYRLLHAIHYYFFKQIVRIIFVIHVITKNIKASRCQVPDD